MIRKITFVGMAACLIAGCGRVVPSPSTNVSTKTPAKIYEDQTKIWKHCNAASRALIKFEPDVALKELDTAYSIAPDNSQVAKMRAAALAEKGKFFEASEELTRLIELGYGKPQDLIAIRAQYFLDAKLNDKAIDDCDRVLKEVEGTKNPSPPGYERLENIQREFLHDLRGAAYYRKTLFDRAEKDFSAILKLRPENDRFLFLRAEAREKLKNSGGADSDRRMARKILARNIEDSKRVFNEQTDANAPESGSAVPELKGATKGTIGPKLYLASVRDLEADAMADIYQRLGENEKAMQTLTALIKSNSAWVKHTQSNLYVRLGWLYLVMGNVKEADASFKQSIALQGAVP